MFVQYSTAALDLFYIIISICIHILPSIELFVIPPSAVQLV